MTWRKEREEVDGGVTISKKKPNFFRQRLVCRKNIMGFFWTGNCLNVYK